MSEPGGKTTRIAIFGHFDGTNFGNEATLQAVLHNLRRSEPGVEVTCICTGPQMTAAAHHIRAIPVARTYLKSWAPRNPIGRFVRKICLVMGEPVRWFESIINLWGTDIFLVPGTGLLTDAYGILSWGPYNLLRWSLVAKLCRCRLVFISVGAGPFFSGAGRFLSSRCFRWRTSGLIETNQQWIGSVASGCRLERTSFSPIWRSASQNARYHPSAVQFVPGR